MANRNEPVFSNPQMNPYCNMSKLLAQQQEQDEEDVDGGIGQDE